MKEKLMNLADSYEAKNGKILFNFENGIHVSCFNINEPVSDVYTAIVYEEDKIVLFNDKCYLRFITADKWSSVILG